MPIPITHIKRSSSSQYPRADYHGYAALISLVVLISVLGSTAGSNIEDRSHKLSRMFVDLHSKKPSPKEPNNLEQYFEVSRPVTTKLQQPVESIQLLYYEFANTINSPPAVAQYLPSKLNKKWNKVVLKWRTVVKGIQFDRIAAVWLSGVEILRTSTAEPTPQGIFWELEKDVTRYSSLWRKPQEVVVSLGNVVDSTYTGIFNVTLSVDFYQDGTDYGTESEYSAHPADVILPIAQPTDTGNSGGYWFQLVSEADKKKSSLTIPQNAYKAVLEVCLSFHGNDEFWYTNPPNSFLTANNITNFPGNGAFRQIIVSIDDRIVAVVSPTVVVYTGGIDPQLWSPVVGIGAFVLPSYDFDITPLLGYLLDGEPHTFSITVTNALYYWYLDANVFIWQDPKSSYTTGRLIEYTVPSSKPTLDADFSGLDGTFITKDSRTLSYAGYVASSFGNLTTSSFYSIKFSNTNVFANDTLLNTVDQLTQIEGKVVVETAEKVNLVKDRAESSDSFSLYILVILNVDNSTDEIIRIVHSVKSDLEAVSPKESSYSSLSNLQRAAGELHFFNNVVSGTAVTNQTLSYESSDGCFQRTERARDYAVVFDKSSSACA